MGAMKDVLEPTSTSEKPWPTNHRHPAGYSRGLRALGWVGVALAVPFFAWVPLAFISPLPSMIDVFGVVGLRIPASITIGGLLMAAIGFHKF